jgi:hypothetical protein
VVGVAKSPLSIAHYTEAMLERASTRMLPVINRAADAAPLTTACCNACRTCVTTNLLGLVITGASALGLGVRRFAKRAHPSPVAESATDVAAPSRSTRASE